MLDGRATTRLRFASIGGLVRTTAVVLAALLQPTVAGSAGTIHCDADLSVVASAMRSAIDGADLCAAGAQEPPIKAPEKCIKCHDLGRRPCSEHPADECEWEVEVLYCSEIAGCAGCGGVGWVDCKDCEEPVAEKWLTDRRAKVVARKTALKYIDDAMKREVRKAETEHVVLVWEMEEMKVEKRRLSRHELLHLYAKRLETHYADFRARLQLTDRHFTTKSNVFVWYMPTDHEQCGLALCEQNARGGVKLMGSTSRYTVCGNKQNFRDDEALHRNIVHSATHLMLANVAPSQWIGNIKGGWMDEGLAHWFEDRYWGICDNYCYQEQNSNVDFKGGKYRLAVRKMVAEGKYPPVAEVFQQNTDTLTLPMHAVSMSYVDYLINQDGAKFYELAKKLKAKVPTGDALKDTFGMRPLEFEALWKSYVLSTYPTR